MIRLLEPCGTMHAWHIHGLKRTTCLAIRKKKCKELIFRGTEGNPVFDIPRCSSLVLLGVTIQSVCKFRAHVNLKLIKANKCLDVLRTLRKEQYSPAEIDHLFTSLVLSNFIDGLPVYGASETDLNVIQNFLDVVSAVSFPTPFWLRIYLQDCEFFKKVTSVNNHPLAPFIPSTVNAGSYNLRKKQCPKINTVRFTSAFVNRSISKHDLSTG